MRDLSERQEKRPLQSTADERALIGICASIPSRLTQARAAGVTADTFYTPSFKKLWEVICAMLEAGESEGDVFNAKAQFRRLADAGAFNALGGATGLTDLRYEGAKSVTSFDAFIDSVLFSERQRARARMLDKISAATSTIEARSLIHELDEQERAAEAREANAQERNEEADWKELQNQTMDLWQGKRQLVGIATGYPELDNSMKGLVPGNIYILAGRPGMGKTALALNICDNIVFSQHPMTEQGKTVLDAAGDPVLAPGRALFISLEMPSIQLRKRLWAAHAEVPSMELDTPGLPPDAETKRLSGAMFQLKQAGREKRLLIDDAAFTFPEIEAAVRKARAASNTPLHVVFIDFLQQLYSDDPRIGSRNDDLTYLCNRFKRLAKSENVAIILLSQMNREIKNRADKRPQLTDLRDSGAIEQIADVVLFAHRPGYYVGASEDESKEEKWYREHAAFICVRKNRHGAPFEAVLNWEASLMKFKSMPASADEEDASLSDESPTESPTESE